MILAWFALVRAGDGLQGVWVTGRNQFEALRAVAELVGPCHVLKLKRSSVRLTGKG